MNNIQYLNVSCVYVSTEMAFSTSKANRRSVHFQMYLLVKLQQYQQLLVNLREINKEPGSLRTGN